MTADFNVYQLQCVGDKEYTSIPGVLVDQAVKTTHRHRQSDLLVMQLSFEGGQKFKGDEIEDLLKEASGLFYHAQGSVTRAIQQIIDHINKQVYERNADWDPDSEQTLGSLNVAVMHNDWLFIGQVGNAHVYRIGSEIYERFGDEGDFTTKIGISRRIQPRFYQTDIQMGDLLLLSPKAHGSWKPYYLSGSNDLPMDVVKRRLNNQMIQDFSALVVKVKSGSGNMVHGNWEITEEESSEPIQNQTSDEPEIEAVTQMQEANHKQSDPIELSSSKETISQGVEIIKDESQLSGQTEKITVQMGETEDLADGDLTLEKKSENKKDQNEFQLKLARIWMNGKTLRAKNRLFFSRLRRKIPLGESQIDGKGIKWRGILSVILPTAIILISVLSFSRYGKQEQYNIFFSAAQEKAALAALAEDSGDELALWSEILDLSINAEKYRVTNESRQMVQKAQSIIDGMELTERLVFHPAMTQSFPEGATISRIKGGASGVYLLDNSTGNVLRIFINTKGFYELDNEFKCTPGDYGLVSMGKVVDFVVLPANEMGYKVLAMDAIGNLLYCQPGEVPVSRTLTMPDIGWGSIIGATYIDEKLILIDSAKNDVYIYESKSDNSTNENDNTDGIVFIESPTSFFDDDVPDLGGAIKIVMNEEDLYILHEDGHVSICHYGYEDVRLTECEDPAPFTDNRESSENKHPWIFMGTNFIDMGHTRLPNNSVYLLDDISGTFFRFSLQLNLENTLKPEINLDFPLPEISPTGFGITQDQELLVAFQNQLFTAPLQ